MAPRNQESFLAPVVRLVSVVVGLLFSMLMLRYAPSWWDALEVIVATVSVFGIALALGLYHYKSTSSILKLIVGSLPLLSTLIIYKLFHQPDFPLPGWSTLLTWVYGVLAAFLSFRCWMYQFFTVPTLPKEALEQDEVDPSELEQGVIFTSSKERIPGQRIIYGLAVALIFLGVIVGFYGESYGYDIDHGILVACFSIPLIFAAILRTMWRSK